MKEQNILTANAKGVVDRKSVLLISYKVLGCWSTQSMPAVLSEHKLSIGIQIAIFFVKINSKDTETDVNLIT